MASDNFNTIFTKFLKFCKTVTGNDNEVLKLLKKQYNKTNPTFLNSPAFVELVNQTRNKIKNDVSHKYVYIKEFFTELKTYPLKSTKPETEPIKECIEPPAKRAKLYSELFCSKEDTEAKKTIAVENAVISLCRLEDSPKTKDRIIPNQFLQSLGIMPKPSVCPLIQKGCTSSHQSSELSEKNKNNSLLESVPDDSDTERKRKKPCEKSIAKLEELLGELSKEIEQLEGVEINLDNLNEEDSNYILLDKYKAKFVKVWNKLCELKGCNPSTGRPVEKKFKYEGTRYQEINRKIERFINKYRVFPDYSDIHTIVCYCNKKHNLKLSKTMLVNLAKDVFTEVGNRLQERRLQDFVSNFGCHITDEYRTHEDPAMHDSELRKKLEENRIKSKNRMEEVINKFAEKQMNKKHSTSDDQDDEDDEEENEEGDEEVYIVESDPDDIEEEEEEADEQDNEEEMIKSAEDSTSNNHHSSLPQRKKSRVYSLSSTSNEGIPSELNYKEANVFHSTSPSSEPTEFKSLSSGCHSSNTECEMITSGASSSDLSMQQVPALSENGKTIQETSTAYINGANGIGHDGMVEDSPIDCMADTITITSDKDPGSDSTICHSSDKENIMEGSLPQSRTIESDICRELANARALSEGRFTSLDKSTPGKVQASINNGCTVFKANDEVHDKLEKSSSLPSEDHLSNHQVDETLSLEEETSPTASQVKQNSSSSSTDQVKECITENTDVVLITETDDKDAGDNGYKSAGPTSEFSNEDDHIHEQMDDVLFSNGCKTDACQSESALTSDEFGTADGQDGTERNNDDAVEHSNEEPAPKKDDSGSDSDDSVVITCVDLKEKTTKKTDHYVKSVLPDISSQYLTSICNLAVDKLLQENSGKLPGKKHHTSYPQVIEPKQSKITPTQIAGNRVTNTGSSSTRNENTILSTQSLFSKRQSQPSNMANYSVPSASSGRFQSLPQFTSTSIKSNSASNGQLSKASNHVFSVNTGICSTPFNSHRKVEREQNSQKLAKESNVIVIEPNVAGSRITNAGFSSRKNESIILSTESSFSKRQSQSSTVAKINSRFTAPSVPSGRFQSLPQFTSTPIKSNSVRNGQLSKASNHVFSVNTGIHSTPYNSHRKVKLEHKRQQVVGQSNLVITGPQGSRQPVRCQRRNTHNSEVITLSDSD